ncbi:CATRA system-associated protein [Nocardia suismassiliense]|uniref:CATRA system-associated protein n=1 Tax=Nocardia suismassiliense TaxID=2077092 RepID=UPI000D1FABEA|nr:CATRA system-associated protein [Nocardia suismassiliense]
MSEPVDGSAATPGVPPLDDETRDDILDVLSDLAEWRLPPPRGAYVAQAVDALTEAVANGDALAVREAIDEVELMGPVRATRIGTSDRSSAPSRVMDRVNTLVHTLGGDPAAASSGTTDEPE